MFRQNVGNSEVAEVIEKLSVNSLTIPPVPAGYGTQPHPANTLVELAASEASIYLCQDIDRPGVKKDTSGSEPLEKKSDNEPIEKKTEVQTPVAGPQVVQKGPPAPAGVDTAQQARILQATSQAEELYDCFIGSVASHLIADQTRAVNIVDASVAAGNWGLLQTAFVQVCATRGYQGFGNDNLGKFLQDRLHDSHVDDYLLLGHGQQAVDDAHRFNRACVGIVFGETIADCIRSIAGYDGDPPTLTQAGAQRLINLRTAFNHGYEWRYADSRPFDDELGRSYSADTLRALVTLAESMVAGR